MKKKNGGFCAISYYCKKRHTRTGAFTLIRISILGIVDLSVQIVSDNRAAVSFAEIRKGNYEESSSQREPKKDLPVKNLAR